MKYLIIIFKLTPSLDNMVAKIKDRQIMILYIFASIGSSLRSLKYKLKKF